eukprot:4430474-Prymnesium_polylepis.1
MHHCEDADHNEDAEQHAASQHGSGGNERYHPHIPAISRRRCSAGVKCVRDRSSRRTSSTTCVTNSTSVQKSTDASKTNSKVSGLTTPPSLERTTPDAGNVRLMVMAGATICHEVKVEKNTFQDDSVGGSYRFAGVSRPPPGHSIGVASVTPVESEKVPTGKTVMAPSRATQFSKAKASVGIARSPVVGSKATRPDAPSKLRLRRARWICSPLASAPACAIAAASATAPS